MSWLDNGFHFDLVVGLPLVVFVTIAYAWWHR
jgi:hypothetical protein